MSIDSLNDESLGKLAFWALETGLWDGRPITYKQIPEFLNKSMKKATLSLN